MQENIHDMHISETHTQGFTLIEFIVIMIIFSIMASVTLFNFTGFRNEIVLSNLAHDIALTIRQTQVGGASLFDQTNSTAVLQNYRGIQFTWDPASNQFSNTFTIFNDLNNNRIIDPGEIVDEITIQSDDRIEIFNTAGGASTPIISRNVGIFFRRPNTEALIVVEGPQMIVESIEIRLTSRAESTRFKSIEVRRSGYIHVVE
ncbi:MAG: prepilin-type N-terminal cleavage/methylation domain-containing protein [Candidatus Pacebacteria bacterium]|nr:prepilin-type N-terminal cleavage/methylation domain-containing protein [Candidatus Paceibacterota bacterium]MCD8508178.1 prepilin-type N-terminal cleavage/methylation domain-containing protein [Candidatus Paceibacterota bacterium]MCD8528188.1 prepilin-type N-terminal cleavage/methylation domain-containing protein [Candidatus Paceibacterota bacterium]MCD8563459.1 prepilin-type N-terminal cleavage/methylation domain-containing protein [Candidatus Paceibacterota bacterium]